MAITINGTTGITTTGDYDAEDNDKILLGTGDDLEIYHNGSDSYIAEIGTGSLKVLSHDYQLKNAANDEMMIRAMENDAVELYHNNVKKLWTESWGINIDGNLALGDSEELIFGGSDDMKIYHNGQHSFIQNGTGNLYIWSANGHDGHIVIQATYGEESIICEDNGAVKLYHNNNLKFHTESSGAKVSGNLTLHTGTSSQIHLYDVDTHTITLYTSSNHFRWWSEVDSDAIAEIQQDGDMVIDGSYSTAGVDYAEYFESTDGSAIPIGTTVVLENGKVRAATGSETPIGVVRPKTNGTSITGGLNELKWQGKYLTDDYDDAVLEDATFCTWKEGDEFKQAWKDSGETIPADATETSMKRRKLNPSFDKSKTYVPRSQRAEWNCVGLLGQIPITKGQPTATNWIKMKERSSTVELWMVK